MAVDVFERELGRIRSRFNTVFRGRVVCDLQSRYLTIMSICRAGILARSVREARDEEMIKGITREFFRIVGVLNRLFDHMEIQKERRPYAGTGDRDRIALSG